MNVTIDTTSPVPPYEQLRAQLHDLVIRGSLEPGTRLPPIRQLARDLGLAVNTVGRAYKELETAGLIESRGRHGTVVIEAPVPARPDPRSLLAAARRYAIEARRQGADLDDAVHALRAAFPPTGEHTTPLRTSFPAPDPDPVGDRR